MRRYLDALYGNDNCADACVDFFRHMVENYNVEEYCHMIGASNGAMTTLNASRKLGSSVKSIIIQYPLASIINQYADGKHQDGIEAAYGLDTSKTYTRSELEVLLADYDPLYYNVKDGVKEGYFPPIKIYYSLTDTTTPASANALLLIAMLNDSGIEYASVQVDSDGKNKPHGHIDHFDPAGFTEWFESHSSSSTAPHEHTFSSKWTTNATHHWNAATCVHSDELANKGEHAFDSDGICTVCGRSDAVTLTVDDMSLGGWAYGTKNPYTYSSPRIGTTELIFVKAGTTIKYDPKGLKIFIYVVDNPGDDFGDRLGWFTKAGEYVVTRDAYVNITVSKSNGTDVIGVSDYVCEVSIIPNKKES